MGWEFSILWAERVKKESWGRREAAAENKFFASKGICHPAAFSLSHRLSGFNFFASTSSLCLFLVPAVSFFSPPPLRESFAPKVRCIALCILASVDENFLQKMQRVALTLIARGGKQYCIIFGRQVADDFSLEWMGVKLRRLLTAGLIKFCGMFKKTITYLPK